MNITELARRLRVNTEELKNVLPGMGFDFGRRAIKIPDQVAWKIINAWPAYVRAQQRKREAERDSERLTQAREAAKEIMLPAVLTVKEFAAHLGLPVTRVIAELMKNGILAAMNERIDYTTASIIANDLGFAVQQQEDTVLVAPHEDVASDTVKDMIRKESGTSLVPRPPVVVVMGHVDHGKTTLLDTIRRTNVVAKEAGGITQHIGAYQVEKKNRLVTFIDTPGHQAFTTMRSRGARVADIAILVVAADDGVQPQTLEALSIIQAAKIPYAVAVNKMDKPDADVERVKRSLSEQGVIPEEWGGTVPFVPVSARTGTGIDAMLDVLLLLADLHKSEIMADPYGRAIGTVIESHVDDQEGVLATILVQNGTLRCGDTLGVRGVLYGRVRALKDWARTDVREVPPGTPVQLLGLKAAPEVGDVIGVPAPGEEFVAQKFKHR